MTKKLTWTHPTLPNVITLCFCVQDRAYFVIQAMIETECSRRYDDAAFLAFSKVKQVAYCLQQK